MVVNQYEFVADGFDDAPVVALVIGDFDGETVGAVDGVGAENGVFAGAGVFDGAGYEFGA